MSLIDSFLNSVEVVYRIYQKVLLIFPKTFNSNVWKYIENKVLYYKQDSKSKRVDCRHSTLQLLFNTRDAFGMWSTYKTYWYDKPKIIPWADLIIKKLPVVLHTSNSSY